ncbi:MAG: hypothetical protein GXY33_19430 [Phycisphaerae bacterium]|nr:hypothetical protein [Phycisphaerae bacterium]
MSRDFRLEALVDFLDDAIVTPFPLTAAHLDSMMALLKARGIRRVSWGYYADARGGYRGPGKTGGPFADWHNITRTYQGLGNPLKVAAEAAHRHGLEIYAYYKPYETGPAAALPEGSPEAAEFGLVDQIGGRLCWFDPFVVQNPHLRIKRRTDDLPANVATRPVCAIRLIKKDDTPTRITAEHLQIWTSPDNYRYKPLRVKFDLQESVEPSSHEVVDIQNNVLTRKGDPVRVLTLSGFSLTDKYILVTTDFEDETGDFTNSGDDILRPLDADGGEIPCVFAPGHAIYFSEESDFRNWGLGFDHGYGRRTITLDVSNASGKTGLIAFARGRNDYLPGALCETEPAVQEFWLRCLDEIIAAGVDGVDFRDENHSTHTDFPHDYGYNDVVLAECRRRGGISPAAVAAVRGDAWTEFYRKAKAKLAAAGKRMRINFQVDFLRPNPPAGRWLAYPFNLDFQWRRWIDEGLLDEAIPRFFSCPFECLYNDDVTREIIDRCRSRNIPLTVNRYVHWNDLAGELRRVRDDERFCAFVFYETCTYLRYQPDGTCRLEMEPVEKALREFAESR